MVSSPKIEQVIKNSLPRSFSTAHVSHLQITLEDNKGCFIEITTPKSLWSRYVEKELDI